MRRLALLALLLTGCLGIPIHARGKARKITPEQETWKPERVEIVVDEKTTLRGVYFDNGGPPVLLMVGSGMSFASGATVEVQEMLRAGGYSVLCCDYRGTGHSSGSWWRKRSRGLDEDAIALWEWMRREKGEPGGVLGVSIGAVAATALLDLEHPPAAVVLDRPVNPRTVIRRFVGQYTSVGAFLTRLLVYAACDCDLEESLRSAKAETLVVFPERDLLHPPRDVARLVDGLPDTVTLRSVPGGHMSAHHRDPVRWRRTILDFLDARLRPGRPPLGGRALPPDPAQVVSVTLEGRTLRVELDRDDLPERIALLVMGHKRSGLIGIRPARRTMSIELSGKNARKFGPLFGARVVPEGFRSGTGSRWMMGRRVPVVPGPLGP